MMPYKQMDEDSLITVDSDTPKGQTVILPTVVVPPGSETTNPAQSPQVVVVVPPPQMKLSDKKAKILCGLGATHVTIGILEILFNIGASFMWAHVAYFTGGGYWCGIFTILSGAFGLAAGKRRKGRCLVITFMVLSIIATILTGILIFFSSVGIAEARMYCYMRRSFDSDCRHMVKSNEAWNSLLLIAGIIEFIISIVSAAMCCYNLCGKTRPTVISPGVQYVNGAQQLNMDSQPQFQQVLSK